MIRVMLVQPLRSGDQTVTLSAGPLTLDAELLIPADAEPHEQETLGVCQVFSKTQAKVVRGARGSIARSYMAGTLVDVSADGLMHEPPPQTVDEPVMATLRPSRRQPLDIASTQERGACPHCGCTGHH